MIYSVTNSKYIHYGCSPQIFLYLIISCTPIGGMTPPKWNYLLEGGPLVGQASPTRRVFYAPTCTSVQLVLLWEAAFGFSELFGDSFNVFARFIMGDLQVHLPTPRWVFSSFWPKMAWLQCSTFSIHRISSQATFFGFPGWKNPERGTFCWCGRSETENGWSTKISRSTSSRTILSCGEKLQ